MEYIALLYGDPKNDAEPGTPEFDQEMAEYVAYDEVAGPFTKSGWALQEAQSARTVRVPAGGGDAIVTDGPFAETTEVMGGYYIFDVESLDEAIDLARQIPLARTGSIEVRPLVMSVDADATDGEGERFLALLYSPKGIPADTPGTPEWDAGAERHGQFLDKHKASVTDGFALHPYTAATTVRVRNGETLVTDGPFAETTEVLGGAYVLRTAGQDAAVDVAKDIPCHPGGAVEVRPIWEMEDMGGEDAG